MSLPLPPDPYKALGVAKDAAASEIKSAYRKLVLRCHPDKVQDPTLKAQKQDEFQKVQQAYELLTDDTKRIEYDEKARMFAFRDTLRSQMPKGSPQSARSSPAAYSPPVFDYEVRTAEPRSSKFKPSRAPSPVRVYATRPASFDEDHSTRIYDMGSRSAKKSASYEERKVSSKDEERRRRAEEKDLNKKNLSASKKTRDKERRRGAEEKTSRRNTPFIVDEDDSEDGYRLPRSERRSSKKSDDKIRVTLEKGETDFVISERTHKVHHNMGAATQYIQAARLKVKGKSPEADFRPPPVRRSETYHGPTYSSRYPASSPQAYGDADSDDEPRRSSARPRSRRPSDALPPRPPPGNEPYIITADPFNRKPSLQTHSSAPPLVSEPRRKEPQRAQTIQSDYSRRSSSSAVPPPLPRASTFDPSKQSRPSRLQTTHTYASSSPSSESDSDGPVYASPSRSSRPSPSVQTGTQKRYVIDKSRGVPVARSSHRKVREDSFDPGRDRSESPRGTTSRDPERPPITRSGTSSARASSSRAPSYYASPTENAPPRSKHDLPRGVQQQSGAGTGSGGPFFGEVQYGPAFRPEDVSYGEYYRPGQPTNYYPQSRRGEAAYA